MKITFFYFGSNREYFLGMKGMKKTNIKHHKYIYIAACAVSDIVQYQLSGIVGIHASNGKAIASSIYLMYSNQNMNIMCQLCYLPSCPTSMAGLHRNPC